MGEQLVEDADWEWLFHIPKATASDTSDQFWKALGVVSCQFQHPRALWPNATVALENYINQELTQKLQRDLPSPFNSNSLATSFQKSTRLGRGQVWNAANQTFNLFDTFCGCITAPNPSCVESCAFSFF